MAFQNLSTSAAKRSYKPSTAKALQLLPSQAEFTVSLASGSSIGHTLGLCYHKQKQYQKAITAYTEAIQTNKFFLDAYIGRGNVYMDLGSDYGFEMAK